MLLNHASDSQPRLYNANLTVTYVTRFTVSHSVPKELFAAQHSANYSIEEIGTFVFSKKVQIRRASAYSEF